MRPEDNPQKFLLQIVQTISMVLLWMIVQVFAGIFIGLGFFEGTPGWPNLLYYIFLLISLAWLIRYVKRKWD